MGQGRGDQRLGLAKSRTQANNLVQGLQSGIEFSRVKLDDPGPEGPKPSQGIVRAGAHRLPQPIERFFAKPAKPQDTTEHADHERAVWIEHERGTGFGDRRLPFATPHPHMRQDGVRRRVLVVERNRNARFFERDSLNLRERARREVPDLPLQGQRVSVMAGSEIRIERDGSAKKGLRGLVFLRSVFVEVPKSPLVGLPSIEPLRLLAQYSLLLSLSQRRLEDTRNTH